MKSLISYPKHVLSILFLFFAFLMIGEAQDYSQVVREKGLIMQRENDSTNTSGVGMINFFHRVDDPNTPADSLDFIFMRATQVDHLNNNLILDETGLFSINSNDICYRNNLPPNLPGDVKLFVYGEAGKTDGTGTWSTFSDKRLKKNIAPLKNSLDILRQVEFVQYEYNGLAETRANKKYHGVVAQQVGKVLPSTVSKCAKQMRPSDKHRTELLMFNPSNLIYTGLDAIKELATLQDEQYEELSTELEEEREKNEILENRVDELEQKLSRLMDILSEQPPSRTHESSSSTLIQRGSKLHNNIPNPLDNSTLIGYELPDNTVNASIVIQNMQGKTLKQVQLPNNMSKGQIEFNAQNTGLPNGTYIYALVVDGEFVDSKKMMVVK